MESCGATIAKRRRAEDCDGDRGYSGANSHAQVLTGDAPRQHKRHRSNLCDLDGYNAKEGDMNEMMMDIYEPLSPPLSEPETMPSPVARQPKRSGSTLVSIPAGQPSMEELADATESLSTIPEYAAVVSHVLDPRRPTDTLPGAAYRNVKLVIQEIANQVGPRSPYATKKNALFALSDIAWCILGSRPTRQVLEVKAEFESDDCIPQLMLLIIQSMSELEVAMFGEESIFGTRVISQLRSSHEKAVENYVAGFYDFSLVLEAIGPGISQT